MPSRMRTLRCGVWHFSAVAVFNAWDGANGLLCGVSPNAAATAVPQDLRGLQVCHRPPPLLLKALRRGPTGFGAGGKHAPVVDVSCLRLTAW